MSGGMSSVKLAGNLCMGTGREADTKPADYRLTGCVGVLFVSVTKRPKRRRGSAFLLIICTGLSHHSFAKQPESSGNNC